MYPELDRAEAAPHRPYKWQLGAAASMSMSHVCVCTPRTHPCTSCAALSCPPCPPAPAGLQQGLLQQAVRLAAYIPGALLALHASNGLLEQHGSMEAEGAAATATAASDTTATTLVAPGDQQRPQQRQRQWQWQVGLAWRQPWVLVLMWVEVVRLMLPVALGTAPMLTAWAPHLGNPLLITVVGVQRNLCDQVGAGGGPC